jgi:6-phosphogluconolactonase (cycloisomerase 2 family)
MNDPCENFVGMAFAMTDRTDNTVSAFFRDMYGALRLQGEHPTGGNGSGLIIVDPLGSQGSLILSDSGRFLLAVNAGDNTVSSLRVGRDSLLVASVAASGGVFPVSIASRKCLVYVVNAGDGQSPANVSGFWIGQDGSLTPIAGSERTLSAPNSAPACAVFSPDGHYLVVSEKATNRLLVFRVLPGGTLSDPVVTESSGEVPFGMAFTGCGLLLVSEAGPNALSSYRVEADGALTLISGSVPNHQLATCWVSVTPDGRSAYTSNAASGTVSLYRVEEDGGLTLIENVPTTPAMDGAPIDSAIDPCGEFLYVLNGGKGSISVFFIGCGGHPVLTQIYEDTLLPEIGAQGIAVL